MDCERTMAASKSRPAAKRMKRRFGFFMRCSELHPRSELHAPEIVSGGIDYPEASISRTIVGKCKSLVIGDIEHLGANLQLGTFADLEFLRERHVQISNSVAAQIREMPRSIPRDIVSGVRETILV